MEWKKFTITAPDTAEELICGMLAGMGYDSVEIEDSVPVGPEESGGLFGDVVPDMTGGDGKARISFYTEADADSGDVTGQIRRGLLELASFADIGACSVAESSTKEEDWINNWKEHFHRFRVDDIVIEPTWEAGTGEYGDAAMVLRIDPGTAFGTGAHESTQIAIRALRKYLKPGDRVLDIGTGSGILGIVSLKSGAESVFGTDLDPNTIPAIEDNLAQNGIDREKFTYVIGNIADDPAVAGQAGFERYDITAANIIAEILTGITPVVPRHLKKGGLYITSGILTEKEPLVLEAAEKAGLSYVETIRMGEWSGIIFRKP